MPAGRLTQDYLARLAEGIHFSGVLLDAERGIAPSPRGFAGRIADALRQFRLNGPDRAIARAAQRGTQRAIAFLEAHK